MLERKILVIGHARHGKDTVAEYLATELGLRFRGSSEICAEFIYEQLAHRYTSVQECFKDRVNNRELWFNMIADYCKKDKARLGKLVYSQCDIYCGIRAKDEFHAVVREFNPYIIWVDASDRLPQEETMQVSISEARPDLVVSNNGSYEELMELMQTVTKGIQNDYQNK